MKNHLPAALMHTDTSSDGNISEFSSIKIKNSVTCKDVVAVFGREFSEENRCVNLPKDMPRKSHCTKILKQISHILQNIHFLFLVSF